MFGVLDLFRKKKVKSTKRILRDDKNLVDLPPAATFPKVICNDEIKEILDKMVIELGIQHISQLDNKTIVNNIRYKTRKDVAFDRYEGQIVIR